MGCALPRNTGNITKIFFLGEERSFSDEVRARLDHGTTNEIHGVATVVGCVMPCFMSAEYTLFEVGPKFMDGDVRTHLLEVSADGLIRNCATQESILVEIKCPAPKDPQFLPTHYRLPVYYVPQILCEMAVYGVKTLLFIVVSTTCKTATLHKCSFNEALWTEIWGITKNLYDKPFVNIPTSASVPWKSDLLQKFEIFLEQNTSFQVEVPLVLGHEDTILSGSPSESPYHIPVEISQEKHLCQSEIDSKVANIVANLPEIVVEAHQCIRKPASEIVAFMLTNSDRKSTLENYCSTIIGFGLKGKSMRTSILKKMVTEIRRDCSANDIRIAAECYDGQWHQHVVTDCDGNPLTRFGFLKQIGMSK